MIDYRYILIAIVIVWALIGWSFLGCNPVEELPTRQSIMRDYQGSLHPHCQDSGFMLGPDDVYVVYNSPNLEEVYHVDSIVINGTVVEVLIQRIYSTSPDSLPCNTPYWDTLFIHPTEELEAKCIEVFAPFILAADTCQ